MGSYSVIKQDVLPYSITASDHNAEVYGANRIGLERTGYSDQAIEALQNALRILTRAGLNTTQALARIEEKVPKTPEIAHLIEFIGASRNGFVK